MTARCVYIPDKDFIWLSAEVVNSSSGGDYIEVRIVDRNLSHETRTLSLEEIGMDSLPLRDNSIASTGVDDMVNLSSLHEASILDNLRIRFQNSIPYTYTGAICIAVNPFKWLDLYNEQIRSKFRTIDCSSGSPHVYSISAKAYNNLVRNRRPQSILVSGESGAGKTETVKILMAHIAAIAGSTDDATLERLLCANPLLESFGNAKTVRNDNSSRFGKFSQLEFSSAGSVKAQPLLGSRCSTYLLEKSRVVSVSPGERSYHIFYQLLQSPEVLKTALYLDGKDIGSFAYLRCGDITTSSIEGVTDSRRFDMTQTALQLVGVSPDLCKCLWALISGILFLGELQFARDNEAVECRVISTDDDPSRALEICCELLGLVPEAFMSSVVSRRFEARGEEVRVPLTMQQTAAGRDALAKELYARAFQWLVKAINYSTSVVYRQAEKDETLLLISLLDIFGFESFVTNRFEQLCINYANEKLQQKFTTDVFKSVQEEYTSEGVDWTAIEFFDNSHVIGLFEGRRGLIAALHEECLFPQGSDSAFLSKFKCEEASVSIFGKSNFGDAFTVKHYAGQVSYTVAGFVERNRDTLPDDMRRLMEGSSNKLISRLFDPRFNAFVTGEVLSEPSLTGSEEICSFLFVETPFASAAVEEGLASAANDTEDAQTTCSAASTLEDFTDTELSLVNGSSVATDDSNSRTHRNSSSSNSIIGAETVALKFKRQLSNLMHIIAATDVHYVRCIKPNKNKSSDEFDRAMVVEQLRSAGVVEAIRISRAAYPHRFTYAHFFGRFRCLESALLGFSQYRSGEDTTERCKAIILDAKWSSFSTSDKVQFGKTKLYFSSGVVDIFEIERDRLLREMVCLIQRNVRSFLQQRRFLKIRRASIIIQSVARCLFARLAVRQQVKMIVRIQTATRGWLARVLVDGRRRFSAATKIQSRFRQCVNRRQYRSFYTALKILQSITKMRLQKSKYISLRDNHRKFLDLTSRLSIYEAQLEEEALLRVEASAKIEKLEEALSVAALANAELHVKIAESECELTRSHDRISFLAARVATLESVAEDLRRSEEVKTISKSPSVALSVTHQELLQRYNLRDDVTTDPSASLVEVLDIIDKLDDALEKEKHKVFKLEQQMVVERTARSEKTSDALTAGKYVSEECEQIIKNLKNGKTFSAKIFLASQLGDVVQKSASIRQRAPTSAAVEAVTGPVFECELAASGPTEQSKKLKFEPHEILLVRRGKGKTIPHTIKAVDEETLMHICLEGKGDLNLMFTSKAIRDAIVIFFREQRVKSRASRSGNGIKSSGSITDGIIIEGEVLIETENNIVASSGGPSSSSVRWKGASLSFNRKTRELKYTLNGDEPSTIEPVSRCFVLSNEFSCAAGSNTLPLSSSEEAFAATAEVNSSASLLLFVDILTPKKDLLLRLKVNSRSEQLSWINILENYEC